MKSRHSNPNGACVDVVRLPDGHVAVSSTTDRNGPVVVFTEAEWRAFILGVEDGEFGYDRLEAAE